MGGQGMITVRLANAGTTSAGAHSPGDEQELPFEEAQTLIRSGLAVRVPWR